MTKRRNVKPSSAHPADSNADWLSRMDSEVEAVARILKREVRPRIRTRSTAPRRPPLRKIVARFPERPCVVRELLECGHWHTAYEFESERTAKRRQCHDCLTGRSSGRMAEL